MLKYRVLKQLSSEYAVTPSQQEKDMEDPPSTTSQEGRNVVDPLLTSSQQQRDEQPSRLPNSGLRHNDEDEFLRKRKL